MDVNARLCSSGTRLPQATNIWSRVTEKKSGRPSRRIDFGLCENPKRNQQTYRNGTEQNKKKLHDAPWLLLARKAKALKAQCNQ